MKSKKIYCSIESNSWNTFSVLIHRPFCCCCCYCWWLLVDGVFFFAFNDVEIPSPTLFLSFALCLLSHFSSQFSILLHFASLLRTIFSTFTQFIFFGCFISIFHSICFLQLFSLKILAFYQYFQALILSIYRTFFPEICVFFTLYSPNPLKSLFGCYCIIQYTHTHTNTITNWTGTQNAGLYPAQLKLCHCLCLLTSFVYRLNVAFDWLKLLLYCCYWLLVITKRQHTHN